MMCMSMMYAKGTLLYVLEINVHHSTRSRRSVPSRAAIHDIINKRDIYIIEETLYY